MISWPCNNYYGTMRHFSRGRFADSFVSVRLTFTSAHGGCRPPTAENNAREIPSVPPRLTSRHASLRLTLVDGCRGRTSDLNAVEYAILRVGSDNSNADARVFSAEKSQTRGEKGTEM